MKFSKCLLFMAAILLAGNILFAATASIETEHMASLSKYYPDYCFLDGESTVVGYKNPKDDSINSAVMRFDLSNYIGTTATADGVITLNAKLRPLHTSDDGDGFQLIELDTDFEFPVASGTGGLSWLYKNSDLDEWKQGPTLYEYDRGAVWDTTYGAIGTFTAPSGSSSYDLKTVTVPQETIQRWIDNGNKGVVIAPGKLDTVNYGYYQIYVAGFETGADPNTPPTLEFEYTGTPTSSCGDWAHPYPEGDLNQDCHVDMADFRWTALGWLECTSPECID